MILVSVPNSEVFKGQVGVLKESSKFHFKVEWPNNKIGIYTQKSNEYEVVK